MRFKGDNKLMAKEPQTTDEKLDVVISQQVEILELLNEVVERMINQGFNSRTGYYGLDEDE